MNRQSKILITFTLIVTGCTPPADDSPPENLTPPPTIITASGIEMILIPAGSFTMGDDQGPPDTQPAHQISLNSFYLDKFEVTQELYTQTMATNPSKFGRQNWKQHPVDRIDWRQAALYCNERSRRENLTPCYDEQTFTCNFNADGYRLPTEAEWEYACRTGASDPYFFGPNTKKQLHQYAWFKDNADHQTHPVGSRKPNPWGLHDMTGNVAEWCHDFYDPQYYQNSPPDNPRGPNAGDQKVLRGGAWNHPAEVLTAAFRLSDLSGLGDACLGNPAYGFRCAKKYTQIK